MVNASATLSDLEICPSLAHRCMIELVGVALGIVPGAALQQRLAACDPDHLAQIANSHQVHNLIHSAFEKHPPLKDVVPRDLQVYFQLMYSTNAGRNQQAQQELGLLGELFHRAGIEAIILKGGAELLAPYYGHPAQRFLSDLDILVPEARLQDAAEILYARGGSTHPASEANSDEHHHLPAIEGGELPLRIELHRSIGDGASSRVLPAADIFVRSLPSGVEGIRIPSPTDRFTHHILHVQLRSQLYARRLLNLRFCADHLRFLHKLDPAAITETRNRLATHELLPLLDSLDALTHLMFNIPQSATGAEAQQWATRSLQHFGQPQRRKYLDSLIWLKTYASRFLSDPTRRRRYLRKAFSIKGWAQFFAFHKERLQRLI